MGKLNYIHLINRFWEVMELTDFTPSDALLYFALLNACNRLGWKNPFQITNARISLLTGLSKKTILASRERLEKRGLIKYKNGKKNELPPTYWLPETNGKKLSFPSDILGENLPQNDTQKSTPTATPESNLNTSPINKTKIETKNILTPTPPNQEDPPELTEEQKKRIKKAAKKHYAENVTLTTEEYTKLCEAHTEAGVKRMIEILDNYKGQNGKRYKSDYRAILNWVVQRYNEEITRQHGTYPQQYQRQPFGFGGIGNANNPGHATGTQSPDGAGTAREGAETPPDYYERF